MIFLRLFLGWLFQAGPFAFLCFQPFVKQLRFPMKKTGFLTAGLFFGLAAVFALSGCALHEKLPPNHQLFTTVNLVFIITLIPCLLWYLYAVTAVWQKKLFVFFYTITGALMITSLSNLILTKLLSNVELYDGLPYRGYTLPVLLLMTVVLLPVLSLTLRQHCRLLLDDVALKENLYLAILSAALFTILYSGLSYINYDILYNPMALFLYAALFIAIFVVYGILFKMLDILLEKLETQRKYSDTQRQLSLQEEQYRRISDNMETARRMRHDLRHHMVTLQGFLKNGETAKAEEYLEHYLLFVGECEIPKLCGNAIVNAVVGHYQMLAKEQNVRFSMRIAIPNEWIVKDMDLSVLLGNLLENALDAALTAQDNARFICLNMICSGKMLAITVDNGFHGAIEMEGERYLSTKTKHSGFGLSSVRAIAEKYSGGVEFTHDEKEFHSSVMLSIQPLTAESGSGVGA